MTDAGGQDEGRAELRRRVRQQSGALSDALRQSARTLRRAKTSKASALAFRVGSRAGFDGFARARARPGRIRLWLFLFAAVLPAALVVLYFAVLASPRYVAEARFAVRNGERSGVDAIAALTGLASFTQAQDSLIVVDYLKSRAIVEDLDREVGLRALYSRPDIDWLSRFDASDPVEDLVRYWRWKVKTGIESPSGIVTVSVSAFSPEDALRVAQAVVGLSEKLVNGMTQRARRDALADAEGELARAEKRLAANRIALRDLRNEQAMLDPKRTAEGIGKLVGELRLEKARLDQDIAAARRSAVSETAPQMQLLRTRTKIVADQIAALERQVAGVDGDGPAPIAGKITRFDELELERQIAEKQYTLAAAGLERARANAERQSVYLTTFVQPVLPQEVAYPKRLWFSLAGVAIVMILHFIGMAGLGAAYRKLARG